MARVEKSVFISYRRTNAAWALAVYQYLEKHDYDIFFDFNTINSGSFEQVIIENIKSRAHFIIILTPSALERCKDPNDWLRREIETAIAEKRNIIPLMLDGFSFKSPSIAAALTGGLAPLKDYNALDVPITYFEEAMNRLRDRFLNVPLDAVLHPRSAEAERAAQAAKQDAKDEAQVTEESLTASQWFEKGYQSGEDGDYATAIHEYTEAIRLNPDYTMAYYNRGKNYNDDKQYDLAIADFNQALQREPDNASVYNNRGFSYYHKGDLQRAADDWEKAIELKPDYALAKKNLGIVRKQLGQ